MCLVVAAKPLGANSGVNTLNLLVAEVVVIKSKQEHEEHTMSLESHLQNDGVRFSKVSRYVWLICSCEIQHASLSAMELPSV